MQIDETISLTIGEADRGIRVILRVHLELQKLLLDLFRARLGSGCARFVQSTLNVELRNNNSTIYDL
jgi:hypothetical protein